MGLCPAAFLLLAPDQQLLAPDQRWCNFLLDSSCGGWAGVSLGSYPCVTLQLSQQPIGESVQDARISFATESCGTGDGGLSAAPFVYREVAAGEDFVALVHASTFSSVLWSEGGLVVAPADGGEGFISLSSVQGQRLAFTRGGVGGATQRWDKMSEARQRQPWLRIERHDGLFSAW